MRKKVAVLMIVLNEPYWPYVKDAVEGSKKFLLKNHDVDHFLWSDMPPEISYGATVFPTEAVAWPYPTLMRYHLFLQQEEKLKEYDYIFYHDVDMQFVGEIGDEILGDGLTAAAHPMYWLRPGLYAPYETNPDSSAFIPMLGRYIYEKDKPPRFAPFYAAGGFQGGKAADFIKAMKAMKRTIDEDFSRNYIARWNDESHFNRYLYDNPPAIILDPSYVYPDSLIKEYYEPIWGRSFTPKLVTLTKKFTTTKEAGQQINETLQGLKPLQL